MRVIHDVFVVNFQHRSGQSAAPVCHQAIEAQIVAPGIEQVVAVAVIREADGEQLTEVTQASIERIAAHTDHPRVGQCPCNVSDVKEIERQLIDEMSRACSGWPGAFQISAAQLLEVHRPATFDRLHVQHSIGTRTAQALYRQREILQLAGGMDLRMTG